jgi:hypothetical protein
VVFNPDSKEGRRMVGSLGIEEPVQWYLSSDIKKGRRMVGSLGIEEPVQ